MRHRVLTLPKTVSSSPPRSLELDAVYRAHVQLVSRWVQRLGGPLIDIEDVVHDVFLKVQRLLPEFRGDCALTTWLYSITANVVHHRRRKEWLRRWLGTSEQASATSGHTPSVHEAFEQQEQVRLVYRLLDRLPERHRTILILCDLEELSAAEVEILTGVRAATVRVRLHRARAQFAARLERERAREQLRDGVGEVEEDGR
jgi:RNA polymerase sigma-70 factor (ECF subfamily)